MMKKARLSVGKAEQKGLFWEVEVHLSDGRLLAPLLYISTSVVFHSTEGRVCTTIGAE